MSTSTSRVSRRSLLLGSMLALPAARLVRAADLIGPQSPRERQLLVLDRRRGAAQAEFTSGPPLHATNGDEDRYADRRASFTKTMPHNDLGEVDPAAYKEWLAILASGDSARFADAPRAAEAVERLNNPQAAYSIDLVGTDPAALALLPPPAFASQAMAAEMVELYWRALMRDVPFYDYDSNALLRAAIGDLGAAGHPALFAAKPTVIVAARS